MTWITIVLLVLAAWLAIKAAGFVLKLLAWCVLLGGIYWLLAPVFGWPHLF